MLLEDAKEDSLDGITAFEVVGVSPSSIVVASVVETDSARLFDALARARNEATPTTPITCNNSRRPIPPELALMGCTAIFFAGAMIGLAQILRAARTIQRQ